MRKILCILIIISSITLSAQTIPFLSTSQISIGTTTPPAIQMNAEQAIFSNKVEFSSASSVYFDAFATGSNQLLAINPSGKIISVPYPGLVGPWQVKGTSIYYSNGTSSPVFTIDINGNSNISGSASIGNGLAVNGNSAISGSATIGNGLAVNGSSTISGSASIGNGLTVNGSGLTVNGSGTISGSANIGNGGLMVNGNNVAMPGLVISTNTELMGIDQHGNLAPVSSTVLANILFGSPTGLAPCYGGPAPSPATQGLFPFSYNANPNSLGNGPGTWEIYPCVTTGFGTLHPDALVSINVSQTGFLHAFSVATSNASSAPTETGTLTDLFYIDGSGDTWATGNATIGGSANITGSASITGSGSIGNGLTVSNAKGSLSSAGLTATFVNGNNSVLITSKMGVGNGDFNPMSKEYDNGIFWTDGLSGGGKNLNSGFVIAPWSNSNAGIRIDASGEVFMGGSSSLWTTYSGSPYAPATSNTNGGWTVPLTIPNGGAIRTASTGILGRYLGFGMVDGPSSSTSSTGWYWIVEGTSDNTSAACYPMTLILDNGGNATLTVSQNGWCDYVFDKDYKQMTIEDKENYYKTFKHLPGIDPENIVHEKGLNITKNMTGMLQNIEEDRVDITKLYDIIKQQQKEIEELNKKLNSIKQEN